MKPRVAALAALNREIGIRGGYQNHIGTRIGASVWDLGVLLEGRRRPTGLGVQYDIRHAVAEGGGSWPVSLRMIAPHIDTIAVKDMIWAQRPDKSGRRAAFRSAKGWWISRRICDQLLAFGPLPPRRCTSSIRRSRWRAAAARSGASRRWRGCAATSRDSSNYSRRRSRPAASSPSRSHDAATACAKLSRREFLAVAGAAAALPLVDRVSPLALGRARAEAHPHQERRPRLRARAAHPADRIQGRLPDGALAARRAPRQRLRDAATSGSARRASSGATRRCSQSTRRARAMR